MKRYSFKISFILLSTAFYLISQIAGSALPSVYAAGPGSMVLRVTCDSVLPASITDLAANPDNAEDGKIDLTWTAPGDNGTNDLLPSAPYVIRWDTHSVAELGGTTTSWWDQAVNSYAPSWAPEQPGAQQAGSLTYAINNLYPGCTYYIAVKARDKVDKWAADAEVAFSIAGDTAPAKVLNVGENNTLLGNELTVNLSWDDLSGAGKGVDFDFYRIYRDTSPPEGPLAEWIAVDTTTSTYYTDVVDTDLYSFTSYYYRIAAVDKPPRVLEGTPSDPVGIYNDLPPGAPAGLAAAGSDGAVDLLWTANTEPDLVGYNVYCSTYSMGYSTVPVNAALIINNYYKHTGLTNGATYFCVITAVDNSGNESGFSGEVNAVPVDNVRPMHPLGIRGEMVSNNEKIKIIWSAVEYDEDGSPCTDLLKYNIYRAFNIDDNFEFKDSINYGSPRTWTEPEIIKGKVYNYMVRAEDTSGNESMNPVIVNSSLDTDIIAINANNPLTRIEIPGDINYVMLKENNDYNANLWIRVTDTGEEVADAVKVCQFDLVAGVDTVIRNFAFDQAIANIVISYEVEGGYVKEPMSVREDEAAENLAIFWFNGVEWIKIGGEVNEFNHTISVKSKRLGKYAVMITERSESFAIESIQPDKIFTPNGDDWNDFIEIQYINPSGAYVEAKIYNVRGVYIADMVNDSNDESLRWYGDDKDGNPAPGGVYIYQITVTGEENKILNGTVVVAR